MKLRRWWRNYRDEVEAFDEAQRSIGAPAYHLGDDVIVIKLRLPGPARLAKVDEQVTCAHCAVVRRASDKECRNCGSPHVEAKS